MGRTVVAALLTAAIIALPFGIAMRLTRRRGYLREPVFLLLWFCLLPFLILAAALLSFWWKTRGQ